MSMNREYELLIGAKILKVEDGIDGLKLTTDKGIFELSTTEYPDGGYQDTFIQKIEEEKK